jgi:ABC-type transport system involved in cytochrome c biogenesis ATPase subunit/GNAT superfamily N-acetyltransferase
VVEVSGKVSVTKVAPAPDARLVSLSDGRTIAVPRFASITRGDLVWGDSRAFGVELQNGRTSILPAFRRFHRLRLGSMAIRLNVKDIESTREFEEYRRLAAFHYRSAEGFGRRTPIIAVIGDRIVGFAEITTGFLMSKPRTKMLDAPYADAFLQWDGWGSAQMRSLTSAVARISRLVVHPEFRGVGIGTVLVKDLLDYAHHRFQANGLSPIFVEITADMLKYVPFAERAGMHYIGDTEGNLHRVAKDLRYLFANKDKTFSPRITATARGIMSAQRTYATSAAAISRGENGAPRALTIDELTGELDLLNGKVSPEQYQQFHGVLRLPKPTYLAGLTADSRRFLRRRLQEVPPPARRGAGDRASLRLTGPIVVADLTIQYRAKVPSSPRTLAVQEAFGIAPGPAEVTVVRSLSASIEPGTITLITGASGSGKTTLLRALAGEALIGGTATGTRSIPSDAVVGWLEPIDSGAPLVDAIAPANDVAYALHALNLAGLSEAHLFLRPYSALSSGQRYRASLAALIASAANVWVGDEFLSSLDPLTSAVVARQIARHVRKLGIALVVAAPHVDHFVGALEPDTTITLSSGWAHRVEYREARRDA